MSEQAANEQTHGTPALLDMEQAANRIGVPLRRLREWVASGEAPTSCRIGRRRYFRAEQVDAWIDAKFTAAHTH